MTAREIFGTTRTGETVERVRLSGGGLTAHIITFGAAIQDLRLAGHEAPLVLGFERFEDYEQHSPYFGATPGRCANRIARGRFAIDGRDYQLELNERGTTHLHGGSTGTARMNWRQKINRRLVVVPLADSDPARQRATYPDLGLAVDHRRVEDIAPALWPDWLQQPG